MDRAKESQKEEGLLSPYRVLDLTDEKGLLCGKLLADLGADVIKVEKPCGDSARNIGPFYHDIVSPETSLFWFAYNANKRSITLDFTTRDGKGIFERLVKTADFVVESFPPDYLAGLGLDYKDLARINPRIVMASITAFGHTGPYAHYKGSDIVVFAMGMLMSQTGDKDRPPLQGQLSAIFSECERRRGRGHDDSAPSQTKDGRGAARRRGGYGERSLRRGRDAARVDFHEAREQTSRPLPREAERARPAHSLGLQGRLL